jgi:integrase/recombinase XerD
VSSSFGAGDGIPTPSSVPIFTQGEPRLRQQIDVHGIKGRYESALRQVKTDKQLSEYNRKTILRFIADLQADSITVPRQIKYLRLLPPLAKQLKKDFNKARVEDIKRIVTEINQSKQADWTKSDYRVTLKRFYRWLRKLPKGQNPPETSWIRIGGGNKRILPEELLTEEDITKLVEACENSRDRALVLCIYETGGRIGEILNLRRKHVQFDKYGATLIFSGKTGDRRALVLAASPALAQWINDHPIDDPEAPLWLVIGDRNHHKPLLYDAVRIFLRRLAKKAGVQKRVNPHSFRHARASYLANHLTEAQLENYLGWIPGSKMPKIYVHLSGRDVDSALLRLHGVEPEEEKQRPKIDVVTCPRCSVKNMPTARFCNKCGLPLQIQAAMEVENARKEADALMSLLLEDPDIKSLMLTKLRMLASRVHGELQPSEAEHPLAQPA